MGDVVLIQLVFAHHVARVEVGDVVVLRSLCRLTRKEVNVEDVLGLLAAAGDLQPVSLRAGIIALREEHDHLGVCSLCRHVAAGDHPLLHKPDADRVGAVRDASAASLRHAHHNYSRVDQVFERSEKPLARRGSAHAVGAKQDASQVPAPAFLLLFAGVAGAFLVEARDPRDVHPGEDVDYLHLGVG